VNTGSNQISTSNRYTALLEVESENQHHRTGPENTPKTPQKIFPFIQLVEQIARQQYETKALADNQVKIQPKTSYSYATIIRALAEKRTEFRTYRLKAKKMLQSSVKKYALLHEP
jgi:hypothetical protein